MFKATVIFQALRRLGIPCFKDSKNNVNQISFMLKPDLLCCIIIKGDCITIMVGTKVVNVVNSIDEFIEYFKGGEFINDARLRKTD